MTFLFFEFPSDKDCKNWPLINFVVDMAGLNKAPLTRYWIDLVQSSMLPRFGISTHWHCTAWHKKYSWSPCKLINACYFTNYSISKFSNARSTVLIHVRSGYWGHMGHSLTGSKSMVVFQFSIYQRSSTLVNDNFMKLLRDYVWFRFASIYNWDLRME